MPAKSLTIFAFSKERSELSKPNVDVSINLKNGDKVTKLTEVSGQTNAKALYVYIDRKVESELKIEPRMESSHSQSTRSNWTRVSIRY